MEYNKKQRHLIYKKMLKNLPNIKTVFGNYSLCLVLMRLIDPGNSLLYFTIPEEFKELISFKPENKTYYEYWFPGNDLETRQIVLEFCIEMTKP